MMLMLMMIDAIYVLRELLRLTFVVATSPFALIGGLLLLTGQQ